MSSPLVEWLRPRWGPVVGVVGGLAAATASRLVSPIVGDPDHLALFGHILPLSCQFRQTTGLPCASCGMTRSWVWLARGEVAKSFQYNAAGASLLVLVLIVGLGCAWTLAGRTLPRRTWMLGAVVGVAWPVVWLGGWALRLAGHYPMP